MINLGVVGLGYWGQRHVESARASGRFNITHAADLNSQTAVSYAETQGIRLTTDIRELLYNPKVDAISLATPHTLHPDQIEMAGKAGKHVYTEKPFAFTRAEAERAVEACKKTNVVVALGHDQRFYPAIMEVKRLLEIGELGKALHVESNISHNAHQIAYQTRADAALKNDQADTGRDGYSQSRKPAPWRMDPKEAPTGPMVHFGIHRIDAFIHLIGEIDWLFSNPAARTLDPKVTDTISVMLRFKNGATGYLGCSLSTPLNSRLQVFGSDGWVHLEGPHDAAEYAKVALKTMTLVKGESRQTKEFKITDSVKLNFISFANAIEEKEPFIISPREMVHNAAVMEAITKSSETGNQVFVE